MDISGNSGVLMAFLLPETVFLQELKLYPAQFNTVPDVNPGGIRGKIPQLSR